MAKAKNIRAQMHALLDAYIDKLEDKKDVRNLQTYFKNLLTDHGICCGINLEEIVAKIERSNSSCKERTKEFEPTETLSLQEVYDAFMDYGRSITSHVNEGADISSYIDNEQRLYNKLLPILNPYSISWKFIFPMQNIPKHED